MDRNVEMFLQIEKSLVQNKCLKMPQVFIQSNLDKSLITRLREIVKRHQGHLVENVDEATHVVSTPPITRDEGLMSFNVTVLQVLKLCQSLLKKEVTENVALK